MAFRALTHRLLAYVCGQRRRGLLHTVPPAIEFILLIQVAVAAFSSASVKMSDIEAPCLELQHTRKLYHFDRAYPAPVLQLPTLTAESTLNLRVYL